MQFIKQVTVKVSLSPNSFLKRRSKSNTWKAVQVQVAFPPIPIQITKDTKTGGPWGSLQSFIKLPTEKKEKLMVVISCKTMAPTPFQSLERSFVQKQKICCTAKMLTLQWLLLTSNRSWEMRISPLSKT